MLLIPVAAAIPAIYYFVLSHKDAAWRLAGESNAAGAEAIWSWPWWAIVLTVFPLVVPAALAYRLPAPTWQEQAVRVWPFAAALVYLLPVGTFPYHSLQGLALPLGILAVAGVASVVRRPRPWLVAAALFVLTVPGLIHKLELPRNNIKENVYAYYVLDGEGQALDWLERDPRPGGVLAAEYASNLVPFRTGREVYQGALSWTPDYGTKLARSNALFDGKLTPAGVSGVRARLRARFLFASCRPSADLTPCWGRLVARTTFRLRDRL